MPSDLITLHALASELNAKLKGARIDKISEPEGDEVHFSVRAERTSYILAVSANPNVPRIHLCSAKKFNPYAAPSFCMLLRKYLLNAVVESVSTYNEDRIIEIKFKARNELYDTIDLSIIVELLGRYSNILLLSKENKIIEALKHFPPDPSSDRIILPNVTYVPPVNPKVKLSDSNGIMNCIASYSGGGLAKHIAGGIGGFAYLTAAEIVAKAGADPEKIPDTKTAESIADMIDKFYNAYGTALFSPCVAVSDGRAADYFLAPYLSSGLEFKPVGSINEAADLYFTDRDTTDRLKTAGRTVSALITNLLKRAEKSLGYAEERLIECGEADRQRELGDMLTANLYAVKRGINEFNTEDFFRGGTAKIPLDPALNPQQNAAKYYKKYTKLSRGRQLVEKQIIELKEQIEYFKSVLSELKLAESVADIDGIKEELIKEGMLPDPNKGKKVREQPKAEPQSTEYKGFKIYVGRNNLDNEAVTFRIARDEDIFMHARQAHGSHVIIKTGGVTVPGEVLIYAAELAAERSELRGSGNAQVDYAYRKFVKKHPSGKRGMVIYTDYKTLTVSGITGKAR